MMSELSYYKTTSFLLFIYQVFLSFLYPKIDDWEYFLIIKVTYSYLENSSNTENQTTYENHMTTENELTTCVPTKVVSIFLVICPTGGGGFSGKSDNLLPSEKNIHSRLRAKISKPPLLLVLSLNVYSSTLLCLNYRQLGIYITVRSFSDIVDTSVHFEQH